MNNEIFEYYLRDGGVNVSVALFFILESEIFKNNYFF